jgi:general secretion pathway protein J
VAKRLPSPRRRRSPRGFTLVEVLVALFVMAVLSGLAWQGVDAMLRTRQGTQAVIDGAARAATVIGQWEQDVASIYVGDTVPALQFDGRTLRLTRSTTGGAQVVAWTVHDGAWWRWSGPATTRARELQQQWLASQQLAANAEGQLRALDGASGWQIYFFNPGDNVWSNAQSSRNRVPVAGAVAASGATATVSSHDQLPLGIRIALTLPQGTLTRDLALPVR